MLAKTISGVMGTDKPSEEQVKKAQGYQVTQAEEQEEGDTRIELGDPKAYFEETNHDSIADPEIDAGQKNSEAKEETQAPEEKFEKVSISKKKFETKKLPKNKKLKEKRDKTEMK